MSRLFKFRALILLVVIAALLGVSAASATPAHWHQDSVPGRCDLCCTAHSAVVQTPAVYALFAPQISGRIVFAPALVSYTAAYSAAVCSRGPPAISL